MDEFWEYAENSLVDGLYWEHWYNGEAIPEEDTGYIFFENKLLGAPRIRQIKVFIIIFFWIVTTIRSETILALFTKISKMTFWRVTRITGRTLRTRSRLGLSIKTVKEWHAYADLPLITYFNFPRILMPTVNLSLVSCELPM